MGTLVGHVASGLVFLVIGLWQLFNHIKLYCQHPKSYRPPIWFPAPKVRHLELYFIMTGSAIYMILELFFANSRHHPLDPADWTIPSNHLHNFEHATISFALFIYAAARGVLSFLLAAFALTIELFIFYLHSTDHAGVEWQYHWLLLIAIDVCLITTVMGIGFPTSFVVGFVRSVSVCLQGIWYIILGVMLYTPRFISKGCTLQSDDGHLVHSCADHLALHRAKALVNLQFAWCLIVVAAISLWFYVYMAKKYPEVPDYECQAANGDEEDYFCESPKKMDLEEKSDNFLDVGKLFKPKDLKR
ncbi:unnamed protein product [Spirodela intermedia]|uniref:Uncharacterized protein n=1 Tax=Spirodela intermedia TaxID=51605 RepID=A0A7I8KBU2_SPIIN|nr:unnamed protein product [Spirodela intermedia]